VQEVVIQQGRRHGIGRDDHEIGLEQTALRDALSARDAIARR